MSFIYQTHFTGQSQVNIHHKFGVTPDKVGVYDDQAQPIAIQSITHTETKTAITLTGPQTGSATVSVRGSRIGSIRESADGTKWAMFITNYGTIQPVRVPEVSVDNPDAALELVARVSARVEELRVAIVSMSERRYMPHNRDKIMYTALDARILGHVNRRAYCEGATNWLTSLYIYYATKATEMSGTTSFTELDAVTWDISAYDQLYDATTAVLGDPEVSILTAMGIPD